MTMMGTNTETKVQLLQRRAAVRHQIMSCTGCGLAVKQTHRGVDGPVPADLLILGEHGGSFQGPEGRLLARWTDMLWKAWHGGLPASSSTLGTPSAAMYTVVACTPGRTPTGQEVSLCRPNLSAVLDVVQPQWVLALGGIAVSTFVDVRIGDIRGRWWWTGDSRSTIPVFSTWSPAAVRKNPSLQEDVTYDLTHMGRTMGFVHGALNPSCVICGILEKDETWASPDGKGGLMVDMDGGSIAFCKRHTDLRWPPPKPTSSKGRKKRVTTVDTQGTLL